MSARRFSKSTAGEGNPRAGGQLHESRSRSIFALFFRHFCVPRQSLLLDWVRWQVVRYSSCCRVLTQSRRRLLMSIQGRCHCGRNAFEVDGELPEKLTRCTCSLCSKRGHLYAYYPPDKFRLTQGDSDAVYRWNSKTVANHFCSACGCD